MSVGEDYRPAGIEPNSDSIVDPYNELRLKKLREQIYAASSSEFDLSVEPASPEDPFSLSPPDNDCSPILGDGTDVRKSIEDTTAGFLRLIEFDPGSEVLPCRDEIAALREESPEESEKISNAIYQHEMATLWRNETQMTAAGLYPQYGNASELAIPLGKFGSKTRSVMWLDMALDDPTRKILRWHPDSEEIRKRGKVTADRISRDVIEFARKRQEDEVSLASIACGGLQPVVDAISMIQSASSGGLGVSYDAFDLDIASFEIAKRVLERDGYLADVNLPEGAYGRYVKASQGGAAEVSVNLFLQNILKRESLTKNRLGKYAVVEGIGIYDYLHQDPENIMAASKVLSSMLDMTKSDGKVVIANMLNTHNLVQIFGVIGWFVTDRTVGDIIEIGEQVESSTSHTQIKAMQVYPIDTGSHAVACFTKA